MTNNTTLYVITFFGLYLELAGAFLLSIEAIGFTNLLNLAGKLRKHRIIGFIALVTISVIIVVISKQFSVLHLTEALILIFSLGIIYDFAPKLIELIIQHFKKGTAGIIGFALFAIGFSLQAYVSLSLLF